MFTNESRNAAVRVFRATLLQRGSATSTRSEGARRNLLRNEVVGNFHSFVRRRTTPIRFLALVVFGLVPLLLRGHFDRFGWISEDADGGSDSEEEDGAKSEHLVVRREVESVD